MPRVTAALERELADLRAKLAVAVEALGAICETPARRFQRKAARAALAQIKGDE